MHQYRHVDDDQHRADARLPGVRVLGRLGSRHRRRRLRPHVTTSMKALLALLVVVGAAAYAARGDAQDGTAARPFAAAAPVTSVRVARARADRSVYIVSSRGHLCIVSRISAEVGGAQCFGAADLDSLAAGRGGATVTQTPDGLWLSPRCSTEPGRVT